MSDAPVMLQVGQRAIDQQQQVLVPDSGRYENGPDADAWAHPDVAYAC
jgi:hypothetical protein